MPSELDDFAKFCGALRVESGRPLVLEPFQRLILSTYFDGTRETLVLIPKKNGKSTLLAALALYHLFVTDDAECVIAAASRDQAQILLNQARGMVRRSPGFEAEFVCKQREIVSRRGDGRIRVLAADADTADGILPSLALVDELHRHRSAELYGVFRDGLGPRDGQQITISTAGDDESSPLGLVRSKMRREGRVEVPEADGWAYGQYRSAGGQMVMHEWCLDRDADQSDMDTVKRANPASWHTVEALRERFESPSTTWWQWARFACGVWVPGDEESAISADEWRGRSDANLTVPGDARWFLGVDLGWKWDTTALVPVAVADDRLFVKDPEILEPPGDGTALDVNAILDAIYAWRTRTGGRTVVLDPNFGGEQLAQTLEARDFEVVSHPQDPSPMADASQRLYEAVRSGRLVHDGNEMLANHIYAACRKVVGGERWRLVKPARRKLPIDGAVALAMAVSVAENPPANTPPMVAFV